MNLLIALLLVQDVTAEDAVARVMPDRIRESATYLAGDELEGRLAGHPGNAQAAEFIADHFRAIGLEPVGEPVDGEPSYFQTFALPGGMGTTRNVVGLLPGWDPERSDEIVVIGAHMDHVGTSEQEPDVGRQTPTPQQDREDRIWNGADDNASGTSTVMEVARAMTAAGYRPRRSILFMLFSAEEWGLNGSAHYVDNTLFPRENHVAMINLDMVGRNPDRPVSFGGTGTAAEWTGLAEAAVEGLGMRIAPSEGVSPGSDHYSFARSGIPAVHIFTSFHAEYHRPADHVDLLAIDHMGEIAKFTIRLSAATADRDERMAFIEGSAGGIAGRSRRVLGVEGRSPTDDEMDEIGLGPDEGAILVIRVNEGSAAESAGIQEGDLIVRVGEQRISRRAPMTELRRSVRRAPADEGIVIEVVRNGERITVTATFDE